MATEIERKFLVHRESWTPGDDPGTLIRQGYISRDPDRVVRIRIAGESGYLTVKGRTLGISRPEFEYGIPLADATSMLDQLCPRPLVEKRRFHVPHAGRIWEVDLFEGENAGLVLAEVELPTPNTPIVLPKWVSREVSNDPRYFNANLAVTPFGSWPVER